MHWNTLNAKLAKKSLAVTRPAAGRRQNPDVPGDIMNVDYKQDVYENDHVPKVCPDWATFDNFFYKSSPKYATTWCKFKKLHFEVKAAMFRFWVLFVDASGHTVIMF